MRILFFVLGLFAVAAIGTPAQAQNYPWCAYYGGGTFGGAMNCGFTSFEQCMATVSGIGGYCDRNTQYVPPPGPHHPTYAPRPRPRHPHRHHHHG